MEIELGVGVLTWARGERVSDHYGSVYLMPEGHNSMVQDDSHIPLVHPEGGQGRLIAEVIKTRKSTHIGDFFRGFSPETPEVGDRLILGEGTLFFDTEDWGDQVGLTPDDDRETDWLDPSVLYKAHEQTVRLLFEQKDIHSFSPPLLALCTTCGKEFRFHG
jgi:hypothetical protein